MRYQHRRHNPWFDRLETDLYHRYRRNVVISKTDDPHRRYDAVHIPEITVRSRSEAVKIIKGGEAHWPTMDGWRPGSCECVDCRLDFGNPYNYYHVMPAQNLYGRRAHSTGNLHGILGEGISPNQPAIWPQSERGYIYAFRDVRDALRWAVNTATDLGIPMKILGFESEEEDWEPDPNQPMQYPGLNDGGWFRSKEAVLPEDFRLLIHYTDKSLEDAEEDYEDAEDNNYYYD
jgi:hypothetical protein